MLTPAESLSLPGALLASCSRAPVAVVVCRRPRPTGEAVARGLLCDDSRGVLVAAGRAARVVLTRAPIVVIACRRPRPTGEAVSSRRSTDHSGASRSVLVT